MFKNKIAYLLTGLLLMNAQTLSKEINEKNIRKYVYTDENNSKEYKIIIEDYTYKVILIPNQVQVYSSSDITDILSFIKTKELKILREKDNLKICEYNNCICNKKSN